MAIIDSRTLASYLGDPENDRMKMLVDLANGIVSELPYSTPLADPPPSRVVAITLEVAGRAYRNPGGFSAENNDTYGYRRDASTAQAGIYLTADERAELLRIADVKPRGSFYTVGLASPLDIP